MPRFAFVGPALGLAAMLALTSPATSVHTQTESITGGLPYCEDIDTFYKRNEAGGANGQCLPSTSPGAYYTKPGEKDANNPESDRGWLCFSRDFAKHLWTNEAAQEQGYEGACLFADFDNKVKPDDVEDCSNYLSHHPPVCSPGPSMYWGACWSSTSEQWKCVPNKDVTIPGLAKGDCKAQVLLHKDGTPTSSFYDGVCRFRKEKVVMYRCDTLPGYNAGDATTCGGGSLPDSACFTLQEGANWQCFQKGQKSTTPCDWTLLDGQKMFYKGSCVFKGNADYKGAKDYGVAEKLRDLKWRWAKNQIPGTSIKWPKIWFENWWNMPADRAALAKQLEKKMQDPKAAAKQYETRKLEFADVDYPEQRKTFADYTKALDWLMLETNIQIHEDL